MKLLNLLIVSTLCSCLLSIPVRAQRPCKEIKASVEAAHTTNQNDGSIKVTIDGNASNFRIFLIAPKRQNNRLDLPVEDIRNLSPGTYELVISEAQEGEFCPKRLKVSIK